jgi:hypothetical protein
LGIPPAKLDWRAPIEVLTGETSDSSEYTNFDFYGWVKYKDPNSTLADDVTLGRWLGVAHSVGQAMTYWILKSNGYVIAHSMVRPLTLEELHFKSEKSARTSFMEECTPHVGNFDPDWIHTDIANAADLMVEPMFAYPSDDDDNDEPAPPSPPPPTEVSGTEPLLNAQVYLAHGDRFEIAKVIERKRNADGLFIGRKHSRAILDSRIFVIEFPDGKQKDVAYDVIAEHIFSQIDSKGNQ